MAYKVLDANFLALPPATRFSSAAKPLPVAGIVTGIVLAALLLAWVVYCRSTSRRVEHDHQQSRVQIKATLASLLEGIVANDVSGPSSHTRVGHADGALVAVCA